MLYSLGALGSISSVAGLIITIWVLIEARKIRKSFLLKARLPDIINDFAQISLSLLKSTERWESSKPADRVKELARCKSILRDIKNKLSKNIQINIDNIIKKMNKKELSDLNSKDIFSIYGELQEVIESLKQTKQNLRWSE